LNLPGNLKNPLILIKTGAQAAINPAFQQKNGRLGHPGT
jgi:hypothetical protein